MFWRLASDWGACSPACLPPAVHSPELFEPFCFYSFCSEYFLLATFPFLEWKEGCWVSALPAGGRERPALRLQSQRILLHGPCFPALSELGMTGNARSAA